MHVAIRDKQLERAFEALRDAGPVVSFELGLDAALVFEDGSRLLLWDYRVLAK